MYRFLATGRWLRFAALALLIAVGCVALGYWQLQRFGERTAINDRIDAAATATAVPAAGLTVVGSAPPESDEWSKITATGVYDQQTAILVRNRTNDQRVGFEILAPLRLADGTAILVDRGWVPFAAGGPTVRPVVPALPAGQVTVTGRLRLPESSPGPVTRTGDTLDVRRISPTRLAADLPYPVRGGWLAVTTADDPAFGPTEQPEHQPSWMNAAYVVQWWLFALGAVAGFGWLARREAQPSKPPGVPTDMART